jgi:hypothetical protein
MYSFLIQYWINHFLEVLVTRFGTPANPGGMVHSTGKTRNATFDEPNETYMDRTQILIRILSFAGASNLSFPIRPRGGISIQTESEIRILKRSSPSLTEAEIRSFADQRRLPDWIRSYLRDFYSEFNNDLAKLLGDDTYKTMWDY